MVSVVNKVQVSANTDAVNTTNWVTTQRVAKIYRNWTINKEDGAMRDANPESQQLMN